MSDWFTVKLVFINFFYLSEVMKIGAAGNGSSRRPGKSEN